MNRSIRLNPDVVTPMTNPEAVMSATPDPSFETAKDDAQDDLLIVVLGYGAERQERTDDR